MPEEFLSITQLAARFGVRDRVIAVLVKQGKIPYIRIGKAVRFRWSVIEAWCDELPGSDPRHTHPAKMPATPSVTIGPITISDVTPEPVLGLVRGAKGKNRERLAT